MDKEHSLNKLILELRDYALNVSIEESRFWTMTIPEVNREIEAWSWREKRRNQFLASMAYRMPTLTAIAVMDSKKYPEIYEAFPNEFDEQEVKEAQRKAKLEKDIAYFKAWAEAINNRRGE